MPDSSIMDWGFLAAVCGATALVAVFLITPMRRCERSQITRFAGLPTDGPVCLFDGDTLIAASDEARSMIPADTTHSDWSQLHSTLIDRFPDFPEAPCTVAPGEQLVIRSAGDTDPGEIICECVDGVTRVNLRGPAEPGTSPTLAMNKEHEILRIASGQAPYPIWHIDAEGAVSWRNSAYQALCEKCRGANPERKPRAPLFPTVPTTGPAGRRIRSSIAVAGNDQKLWFDVSVAPHEIGIWCYAVDINAVVDAEIAQRNFVQTLAKTFAQLSIGLAIFDRTRRLVLFNPALIDLTALPADFLSARPNLLSFFDRLRDQRMMPEPKNYGSWRHQMADLVAAAADGRYQETWSLPSGAVYSVSGRPHPDGAVAFLFEDITAEITLTRRFRTDLEINQSMMDRLDEAIVVFSETGGLTFSNTAYRQLWESDPESSFVQMTVVDATRSWQERCDATPVLGEIRDFVVTRDDRTDWWARIRMTSGQSLTCSVHPIHNGATMVVFGRTNTAPGADTNTGPPARVDKVPELAGSQQPIT